MRDVKNRYHKGTVQLLRFICENNYAENSRLNESRPLVMSPALPSNTVIQRPAFASSLQNSFKSRLLFTNNLKKAPFLNLWSHCSARSLLTFIQCLYKLLESHIARHVYIRGIKLLVYSCVKSIFCVYIRALKVRVYSCFKVLVAVWNWRRHNVLAVV